MSFLDTAWQEGRIAGPATLQWLRSLPEDRARAELSALNGAVVNKVRAEFGDDEQSYQAFLKAKAENRFMIHGARA